MTQERQVEQKADLEGARQLRTDEGRDEDEQAVGLHRGSRFLRPDALGCLQKELALVLIRVAREVRLQRRAQGCSAARTMLSIDCTSTCSFDKMRYISPTSGVVT